MNNTTKKLIVKSNGNNKLLTFEQVLDQYRGLAYSEWKAHKKGGKITPDEKQELDIVIYKAFSTYNEYHCFSTHLHWKIREYIVLVTSSVKRQKRDTTGLEILSLDYNMGNDACKELEYYEMIVDESAHTERDIVDRDFLEFIASHLNDFEMQLLAVNLGTLKLIDLAQRTGTSKQNINNKNNRFKKKLLTLINEYNKH